MKAHYEEVYARGADAYSRLVAREDAEGFLRDAVIRHASPHKRILESGCGTGRVTAWLDQAQQLSPHAEGGVLRAFDQSTSLLAVAQKILPSVVFGQAAHAKLPVESESWDLYAQGWSWAHLIEEDLGEWPPTPGHPVWEAIRELQRVLAPDGQWLFIETAGTGLPTPKPPTHVEVLVRWLETLGAFVQVLRTDYRFESVGEANELVGYFFGERKLPFIKEEADGTASLPECTYLITGKRSHFGDIE